MSLVLRITLMTLLVCGGALYFVTRVQLNETQRRYREATEEPLVDIAMVLAGGVAESSKTGTLEKVGIQEAVTHAQGAKLKAKIYDLERTSFDLHVYVTDDKGKVIYDSAGGRDEGKDYSKWNDVRLTLIGEYGARSSRYTEIDGTEHSILYVAAPIERQGKLLGVLTVGKSTRSADLFAKGAKHSSLILGFTAFGACIVLATVLAILVSAPVMRLTKYAKQVRDGQRTSLPTLPSGELRNLGAAFEEMRDALEGRQYIEKYVQTLAHALKSPLSGIRGAVELLKEELPPSDHARFLSNIAQDSNRMQQLLDKLLALSTLQREKRLAAAEPLLVSDVVKEAVTSVTQVATAKNVKVTVNIPTALKIQGNKLWLNEALINLLHNAIEFSPPDTEVLIAAEAVGGMCKITIRDRGTGIPEWAAEKIFDRFYSLPRPDGGAKSTGLGLSIVREVAALHSGDITLLNQKEGGAVATLSLPLKS